MSANTAVLGIANRRRLGQSLGRAPPTIRNDGTAIKFFNTYRALSEKSTLDKLSYIEIEADNLENLVADMCDFTLSHPIPRYYREGFEPPLSALANEDEPIKILRATVLSQYIGNIISHPLVLLFFYFIPVCIILFGFFTEQRKMNITFRVEFHILEQFFKLFRRTFQIIIKPFIF